MPLYFVYTNRISHDTFIQLPDIDVVIQHGNIDHFLDYYNELKKRFGSQDYRVIKCDHTDRWVDNNRWEGNKMTVLFDSQTNNDPSHAKEFGPK